MQMRIRLAVGKRSRVKTMSTKQKKCLYANRVNSSIPSLRSLRHQIKSTCLMQVLFLFFLLKTFLFCAIINVPNKLNKCRKQGAILFSMIFRIKVLFFSHTFFDEFDKNANSARKKYASTHSVF